MSLSAGSRFGSYEIVGALGAGGMGEVYRARDVRLHRDVAIKVLPAAVAADPDRLARFEREAQVLAALNHPQIGAIYGLLDGTTVPALVLELVDGPTLADRIAQGPLAIDEAQPVARQITEALEAAHEAGIVHRDLKPANIKLRPDGTVKVLDFGLAKALDGAGGSSSDPTNSPTLTALGTKAGLILGTAAYMSPEQARGRTVDKRADIWAFGAVLWEMLTGRRLFDGETISDTLAAVLTKTPDLTLLPPATPGPLRHLISRCLERDPKLRLRDIGEARVVLTGDLRSQPTESPRPRARQRLVTTGVGAAIVAGFVLAFLAGRQRAAPAGAVPVTTFTQVTDRPSIERQPSISPDGRTVVFVGDERGNDDLYLVRVGGRNLVPLTADSDADETTPSFSPDGTRIAFRSERGGGGIFVMDATGESVRRLTESGFDPDWSPDGTALIVADEPVVDPMSRVRESAIWVVTVAKGEKRQVFAGDAVGPRWSPSGKRIAYWSRSHQTSQRDVFTVAADGSQAPVPVTNDAAVDWSPTWSPDGRYIYFASNRGGTMNLWRVAIDEVTGQTLGSFEPVTTPSAWSGGYDFSADGRQLVFAVVNERATISTVPFDPIAAVATGPPRRALQGRAINSVDVSPDGRTLVFSQRGQPWEALAIVRTDATGWARLTGDDVYHRLPTWSPDGLRILCYLSGGRLATMNSDGSDVKEIASEAAAGNLVYGVWSPDGRQIVATSDKGVVLIDPSTAPARVVRMYPAASDAFGLLPFSWSPDGRRIAGSARGHGSARDSVRILDAGLSTLTTLAPGARSPAWLPDSRRLIAARPDRLVVIDADSGETRDLLPAAQADLRWGRTVALSRDGRTLAYLESQGEGDIWLMRIN